jgi:GT2 family glycosyltransferase
MNTFVTAVVVSHNADEFFAVTAQALADQTRRPDRVLVVDTADTVRDVTANFGFEYVQLRSDASLQDALEAALEGQNQPGQWLWVLHDDSAPSQDALQQLMAAVELSPSVAIAGPKLVQWQKPRIIRQLGLTLTPWGAPFSPLSSQFDQGQHDDLDDVLAVSTAAMLIRAEVFAELGGFDAAAPALAADIDLSVRARLAGHRVIVVPGARVQHAELSLRGQRERKWLGASPKTSLRRAAIHLRLAYTALPVALLYWLFLPVIGLVRAVVQVARKRPELIWAEVSAAFWGFFTIFKRLSSRGSKSGKLRIRELRSLRASAAEVRADRRADREREEAIDNLNAFERGDAETLTGKVSRGFFATGGLWWMLALAAASYAFWPRDIAATASGLIPLSDTWWSVFIRAGASYQPIGLGFYAPSDPFAWVLTALAGLTFWAPSLSIAILLFLVKPLAFAGAWKLVAQVSDSTWVRIVAGLGFAFWPALSVAQAQGRLTALISSLALPWFILAVIHLTQLGRVNRTSKQAWTWVAIAGLLLAIIGASTPNLLPLLLLGLLLVTLVRARKVGYLIWVPLPLVAMFGPTALYFVVGLNRPLALLADPGLAQPSATSPFLTLPELVASGCVALIALIALVRKRIGLVFALWSLVVIALAAAYLVSVLQFPAVGVGQAALETVNGSPSALLIAVGLALVTLASVAVDGIPARNARRVIAGLTTLFVVLPSLVLGLIARSNITYSDGRVVPSIVAAEAQQGSHLKLLELTPSTSADGQKRLAAELVAGDGVHLDEVSLAYRFAIAGLATAKYSEIAQLVADLVSANGTPLADRLQAQHIGYVLIPSGNNDELSQLGLALDSVSELEPVGATDYGRLWRVRDPQQPKVEIASSPWSITKGLQVAVLIGFGLMAIPSRTSRRRGAEEIFMEAGEDAQ